MKFDEPSDWLLQADMINELQNRTIENIVAMAEQSHTVNIIIRCGGEDHRFEADWIKHLEKRMP